MLKTRMRQKIDTSENWAKATNFVPLKGEICIYSDLHRMKVGDGTSKIGDLDFEKSIWYTSFTTENSDGTATFTNTVEEIYAAHNSGFEVKAIWTNGNGVAVNTGAIFDLLNINSSTAVFSKTTPSIDEPIIDYHIVMCASEGSMLLTYSLPNTYSNRLLPVTSTDDNDKILKVVNGKWNKEDLLKSVFLVNVSSTPTQTPTFDKTFTEISTAYTAGQTVLARITDGDRTGMVLDLVAFIPDTMAMFSGTVDMSGSVTNIYLVSAGITAAGAVMFDQKTLQTNILPSPTSDDAGKVVTVNQNGSEYTLSTVNALPSVTSTDNDKILKVVNGAWAASASALDKNYFLVTLTPSSDMQTATANKTTTQIVQAYFNGMIPIAEMAGTSYFLSFVSLGDDNQVGFSAAGSFNGTDQTNIIALSDGSTNNYVLKILTDESFTDTEIETFYNANA